MTLGQIGFGLGVLLFCAWAIAVTYENLWDTSRRRDR